ncbi:hypothetical protein FMM01_15770 [Schleiferilactobacillus harbinensis]|uniref:hypothetical protein n=1 Tax=Schleiferilactobacillus harbinensis TaxID=304207 RepID=UPI00123A37EF|nr:hypothetical protein [Schleiferilactobacillus harbinensis]QEU48654.1 hypothetical protein FMM01_15770 [Schleiferilactobacillus harbinensis]
MTQVEVEQLLACVSQAMPIWRTYRAHPEHAKLYRDTAGEPVGLLVFTTNAFHPHALGMAVYAPAADLFPQILADAQKEARRQHKDRLVTWEYRPFSAFTDWLLAQQGFAVWRETVMPTVQLADITVSVAPTADLLTLADIQADPEMRTQLLAMSLADYRRVHAINPMADTTPQQWAQTVFPDVLPSAPLALVRQNRVAAYTFPFEDDPGILTFGWLGAVRAADLWPLQAAQIRWARQQGMTGLSGEFDSTNPLALATYRHWPFAPAPDYTMVGKNITLDGLTFTQ